MSLEDIRIAVNKVRNFLSNCTIHFPEACDATWLCVILHYLLTNYLPVNLFEIKSWLTLMFIGGLKFQADPNLNIQLYVFDFILKLKGGSNYLLVHKEVSINASTLCMLSYSRHRVTVNLIFLSSHFSILTIFFWIIVVTI